MNKTAKKFFFKNTPIALTGILIYALACAEQKKTPLSRFHLVFKNASDSNTLAKIANETFSLSSLDPKDQMEYYELEKRLFEFKLKAVQQKAIKIAISEKAQKENLNFDSFIQKKILPELKVSTDEDVEKFITENRIPAARITPEIKKNIASFINNQRLQSKVEQTAKSFAENLQIEAYFKKPKIKLQINTENAPKIGPDNAPIKIIEFSDFECPFCSKASQTIHELRKDKKLQSKIQIIFKNFPLEMHKNAQLAAVASLCVKDLKPEKYWTYHELLFQNQENLSKESLIDYAKKQNISKDAFEKCLDSEKNIAQVKSDLAEAKNNGLSAAPTFIFNNQEIISGAASIEVFKETIEDLLEEIPAS
jgi:protein-disulfide isomerase